MSRDIETILGLRVPVIVQLATRRLSLDRVLTLRPGSIIDLPKRFDEHLDLLVNNKAIGKGTAVKVNENFGLRISAIGDKYERIEALTEGGTMISGDGAEIEG